MGNESSSIVLGAIAVAIQTPGPGGALGLPILLWGPPGVGKTARLNVMARALDYELITVLASIRGPEDFIGMPIIRMLEDRTEITEFAPPSWARKFVAFNPDNIDWYTRQPGPKLAGQEKMSASPATPSSPVGLKLGAPPTVRLASAPPVGPSPAPMPPKRTPDEIKRGLLFFDEITTAPPRVLAALLRVIHERVVGDIDLPASTAVIAAANPPGQAVAESAQDLQPPLANRFIHFDWPDPSPAEWADWIMETAAKMATADPSAAGRAADAERKLQDFRAAYRLSYPRFVAEFVKVAGQAERFFKLGEGRKKELPYLFAFPEGDTEKAGRAWPSPRSWELGSRGYAAGRSISQPAVAEALLKGAVGESAAAGFLDFLRTESLPEPKDILAAVIAGGVPWLPTGDQSVDRPHLLSIMRYAIEHRDPAIRDAAWAYIALLAKFSVPLDAVQEAVSHLSKAGVKPTSPEAQKLAEALSQKMARAQSIVRDGGSSLAHASA